MEIRHCPGCAHLVHFEPSTPTQKCWNCGTVTNYSHLKTPEEQLGLWLLCGLDIVLEKTLPSCSHVVGAGKVALAVAMPVAIVMLLIGNSFNIHVVHDFTAPFLQP